VCLGHFGPVGEHFFTDGFGPVESVLVNQTCYFAAVLVEADEVLGVRFVLVDLKVGGYRGGSNVTKSFKARSCLVIKRDGALCRFGGGELSYHFVQLILHQACVFWGFVY